MSTAQSIMDQQFEEERWKPVPGFDRYEASTYGQVRNRKTGRIMTPGTTGKKKQYLNYCLRRDNKSFYMMAHKIILETFVGPCPEGMEGCHGDRDGRNNWLDNLRWDTRVNNEADKKRHGTNNAGRGSRHGSAKMTEESVLEMRRLAEEGFTNASLANRFGISHSAAYKIIQRGTWIHI